MGYDYIGLRGYENPANYTSNPDAKGLKFYNIGPHHHAVRKFVTINSSFINKTKIYSQPDIDFYNQNMAWKSTDSFPNNMATGSWNSSTSFSASWDFQQQTVIDKLVEQEIAIFKEFENVSLPFTFAGYMIDETRLMGAFWKWDSTLNKESFIKLSEWTGSDSSLLHSGITHEYATYEEGMVAYYKKLNSRMRQEFPNAKWILEPYRLYSTAGPYNEDWVYSIKDRADKNELIPDMLFQESSGAEFVDNVNIFNSGVNISKDMVGSSQPNSVGEDKNRLYAGKAGINGAWYNWFGRFGGTGDMPGFTSITAVYPRLKLIRVIPNWDNLNNIPLVNRSWDGSVYQSAKDGKLQSYINSDVMYSRHWKNGKIFAVFNTTNTINGKIKLNSGETVTSIQKTDGYFIETGDASSELTVTDTSSGKEITLNSTVTIPIDSTNGQVKGIGYILTVASATGNPAPVITSALSSTGTAVMTFSYQITAANGPTSFNAAGLPAGLSVSSGTGLISGTPTTVGTSSVTISAANAGGTGVSTLTLSVYSACDLNRDASTNVVDVQLQVNQALGATACTSDLNRDGYCSVIDVQRDVNAGLGGQCLLGP